MSNPSTTPAIDQYLDGDYAAKHPDWHLADAPGKARDLQPGLAALLPQLPNKKLRLAEIGAGVGGVLHEATKVIAEIDPSVQVEPTAFEVSPQAAAAAKKMFPQLDVRQKFFNSDDGPFDAVMFIDVLEHVENPWELLRHAKAAAPYMLVRQPLLGGFSTFRHDAYRSQRDTWGHIGFFNYRFFLDMAASTGWKPAKIDLLAPWELHPAKPGKFIQRTVTRTNRLMASFFLSGFYLNGLFKVG